VIYRERMQQDYWRPGARYVVENIGVIANDLLHSEIIEKLNEQNSNETGRASLS
jgi:hypothetical protein